MGISVTAALLTVVITVIAIYYYRIKTYWKRRAVPSCGNILTGCFTNSFRAKENLAVGLEKLYSRMKHEKFVGTYLLGQPLLIVNDPEIIKEVMVSEYPKFASHGMSSSPRYAPIGANLFTLEGLKWKFMRSKMSPSFSSVKLKTMFNVVLDKVQLCEKKMANQGSQTVVYNDYMRRLSIDIICACFFGFEAKCLDDPTSEFWKISFLLNTPSYRQFINFVMLTQFHKLSEVLLAIRAMKFLPKFADDFLMGLVSDIVQVRENSSEKTTDFMEMMVRLKNGANERQDSATDEVNLGSIAAEVFLLFAAGFETTSQTNTMALFEMAKQPKIMETVQAECDEIMRETEGKITYDALAKMEYTDKVIKETLRLYPALHFLTRSAIEPCKLPRTNVELEKDTIVWIPLLAMHKDPQYFPNPDLFDPDRFSPENMPSITPNVYMPFGDGPRTCIGMRFALVSIKTTILTILSKYDIRLSEKMPREMAFEPMVYFPIPARDCLLDLIPRNA